MIYDIRVIRSQRMTVKVEAHSAEEAVDKMRSQLADNPQAQDNAFMGEEVEITVYDTNFGKDIK